MDILTMLLRGNCLLYTTLIFICMNTTLTYGSLTATKCPSLVPGQNQTITELEVYVGESTQVSCDQGYKLDVGALVQQIRCINGSNEPAWDSSLANCIPKECPVPVLGEYMTTSSNISDTFYPGDTYYADCDVGYAFKIDLSLNVSDRVTSSKSVTCMDDSNAVDGVWDEELGNCTVIRCEPAYALNNAVMNSTGINYLSTAQYRCLSGYIMYGRSTLTATCNQSATWEMEGEELEESSSGCQKMTKYVGCIESSQLDVQYEYRSEVMDSGDCRRTCKTNSYRFASLYNDTCSCSNGMADEYTKMSNDQCDTFCSGYDGTDTYQSVFCGGNGSLSSVYVTVDGCYGIAGANGIDSEKVEVDVEATCQERCRAKDFSHAATINSTCYCVNTSHVIGQDEASSSDCDNKDPEFLDISDLAKVQVTAENCDDLFASGIRMHGTYTVKNGTKIQCNFKDGTVCEEGWLGYNGNCYMFYTDQVMNFTAARQFCFSHEAEMVSILDEGELNFLKEARNSFSDLKEKDYYLGLVDSQNTSLFSWLDGNLFGFSIFGRLQPSNIDICVRDYPPSYEWASVECFHPVNIMCKKSKGLYACAGIDNIDEEASLVFDEPTMSLPYCVEICRGQTAYYSAVLGTTCYCLPIVPANYTYLPLATCDTPCPGNSFQFCGNNKDYTLIEATYRPPAKSCEDLQLIGIANGTFEIQLENETRIDFCSQTECPYAWVEIRGSCYRFHPTKLSSLNANIFCATNNAYPVVLESELEAEELMNTVANISVYSSTSHWRLGLQSLSLYSGEYRWANGRIFDISLWSNNFTTHNGTEVLIPKANFAKWVARETKDSAFICEKGKVSSDYLGCYNTSGFVWDDTTAVFEQMTIQQCVEWCRGRNKDYANLLRGFCACSDSLTEPAAGENCYKSCSGQENQICGGDGTVSVFNVSAYEEFANSCTDLSKASIILPGTYMVAGDNKTCALEDSTVCDPGWIGFESNCYQYFLTIENNAEWWYNNDSVMTSIVSLSEELFLKTYLSRLYLRYLEGLILTGLQDPYHLRIFSNPDGLLFNPDILSAHPNTGGGFTSPVGFSTLGFELAQHAAEIGVIAKKDKYKIGCFEIPNTLEPVLSSFNSMELTLCKQLCLSIGEEVAMMTSDSCYCLSRMLLFTMNTSMSRSCWNQCAHHNLQLCGTVDGAVAYSLDNGTLLASTCDELYLSGVFLNTTYLLESGGITYLETCGFSDNTVCPAGWFGKDGECYLMNIKSTKKIEAARESCFRKDSYMFNPMSSSSVWSLLESLTNISVLTHIDTLLTGIRPIFYQTTYVTADGIRIRASEIPTMNLSNSPTEYVAISVDSKIWMDADPNEGTPFVCQKNQDYIGCRLIVSEPDVSISSSQMSLTLCREYCQGQNALLFGTSDIICNCYLTEPSHYSKEGECLLPCVGADTQPCGGNDGNSLFSLFRLGVGNGDCWEPGFSNLYSGNINVTESGLTCQSWSVQQPHEHSMDVLFPSQQSMIDAQNYCRDPDGEGGPWCYTTDPTVRWEFCSVPYCPTHYSANETYVPTYASKCSELAQSGVQYPGEYYIVREEWNATYQVTCFYQPPPFSTISETAYKEMKKSSTQTTSQHVTSKSFYEYGIHEEWRPASNSVHENLGIHLQQVFLITGFYTLGHHTSSDQSWLTEVKLSYRDPLSGTMVLYSHNGSNNIPANTDGINPSYVYFPEPFVTDEVVVYAQEWHNNIALKLFLLGQEYKDFNRVLCAQKNLPIGTILLSTNNILSLQCYSVLSDILVKNELRVPLERGSNVLSTGEGFICLSPPDDDFYAGCAVDLYISGNGTLENDCISTCALQGEAFALLDELGLCLCGYKPSSPLGFDFGFDEKLCQLQPSDGTIIGDYHSKAVYRTFEKKCASPIGALSNGLPPSITYPYAANISTYGTTAKYTCDVGYEFDDGSNDVTIACRQNNQWDNITQTCQIKSCTNFTVENGVVNITSLEYLGEAHVTCNTGTWADNGQQSITVKCGANKKWEPTPTCSVNNLKSIQRYFVLKGNKERDPTNHILETSARSMLDCSVKCAKAYYCCGSNFQAESDGNGLCRLFTDYATDTELSNDEKWKYFETVNDNV